MNVLKKRSDYLATAKGIHVRRGSFVLQARKSENKDATPDYPKRPQVRIGFTVTKKVGSAPARNRMRRRLKSAWKESAPSAAKPGFDYVLIGRKRAIGLPFEELVGEIKQALRIATKNYSEKRLSKNEQNR